MKTRTILAIFCSMLFSITTVHSQDFEPMLQKAIGYFENELYDSAAVEFEAVLPLVEKEFGSTDTSIYSYLVTYTGVSYDNSAQYEKAEKYYLQAKSIFETIDATMDPGYSIALNNLAKLYDDLGRYEEAEPLYKQAMDIDKVILDENDPDYAIDLSNLAALYYAMGRYSLAEPLYKKALEIIKANFGIDHPQYALYLNNLGQLYVTTGIYGKADTLLNQAVEIAKVQLGEDHAQYARYLSNLAHLYFLTGNYNQAETLYRQSVEITEKQFGKNHPSYAIKLNNLAALYIEMNMFDKAEPLLMQALEIDRMQLGDDHPECARVLNNLSLLYQATGRYEQVSLTDKQAFAVYQYQINANTGFLSENELEQFINTFLYYLEIYQSFNSQPIQNHSVLGDFAYDIELTRKGIFLRSALGVKERILESGDTLLINTYYDLSLLKKRIDKLNSTTLDNRKVNPAVLEDQANEMEKTISLRSEDYRKAQQESEISWQDIHKNLNPGEASIEFSSFHYFDGKQLTDSILYCAVILRNTDTLPQFVFLCKENQLKNAIPASGVNSKTINPFYQDLTLYNLIWKPIDSLLQGFNTVYFAPSGLLNSVAMAAIPCPDGKVLSENYRLVQLSSTRTLAMHEERAAITDAVIYGGIKYDPDTTTWLACTGKYKKEESNILAYNPPSFRGITRGGWLYLPGTKKEAGLVAEKLARHNIDTTTFTGVNALEESLYSLSGNNSPSIIHISTHGFYYPDTISDDYRKNMMNSASGDIRFKYADDPLLRSGLIMAGGNNTWKGLPQPEGVEDGILTAREVSNMNLLNTELVVLSACQTGQGDVKGSEGVEGLQRGFKMAGVHYIIMSLWQVPDKETTEFMEHFYDLWPGSMNIRDAFHETQLAIKRKYPNEPYKWAGFVLME